MKMRFSHCWLLVGLCWIGTSLIQPICAQEEGDERILDHLQMGLQSGNKKSLRDIGSLLDRHAIKERVIEILSRHTLFTPEEIQLSDTISRELFLNFYYDFEKEIQFSTLLKSFYLTPIEQQPIDHKLNMRKREERVDNSTLLRRNILLLEKNLQKKDPVAAATAIRAIGQIASAESNAYLQLLLKNKILKSAKVEEPLQLVRIAVQQLVHYRDWSDVPLILQLMEEQSVRLETADPVLSKLTNVNFAASTPEEELTAAYHNLMDSLPFAEQCKTFGYERIYNLKPSFFQYPVDYYGNILGKSKGYPWIRWNARIDLIESKNPRSLFYLAGLLYQRHFSSSSDFEAFLSV